MYYDKETIITQLRSKGYYGTFSLFVNKSCQTSKRPLPQCMLRFDACYADGHEKVPVKLMTEQQISPGRKIICEISCQYFPGVGFEIQEAKFSHPGIVKSRMLRISNLRQLPGSGTLWTMFPREENHHKPDRYGRFRR